MLLLVKSCLLLSLFVLEKETKRNRDHPPLHWLAVHGENSQGRLTLALLPAKISIPSPPEQRAGIEEDIQHIAQDRTIQSL